MAVPAPAAFPNTLVAALPNASKSLALNELVKAPDTAPLAAPVKGSLPCKIAPTAPAIERPVALEITEPMLSFMDVVTVLSASEALKPAAIPAVKPAIVPAVAI